MFVSKSFHKGLDGLSDISSCASLTETQRQRLAIASSRKEEGIFCLRENAHAHFVCNDLGLALHDLASGDAFGNLLRRELFLQLLVRAQASSPPLRVASVKVAKVKIHSAQTPREASLLRCLCSRDSRREGRMRS